jgi:hypothetical protein
MNVCVALLNRVIQFRGMQVRQTSKFYNLHTYVNDKATYIFPVGVTSTSIIFPHSKKLTQFCVLSTVVVVSFGFRLLLTMQLTAL